MPWGLAGACPDATKRSPASSRIRIGADVLGMARLLNGFFRKRPVMSESKPEFWSGNQHETNLQWRNKWRRSWSPLLWLTCKPIAEPRQISCSPRPAVDSRLGSLRPAADRTGRKAAVAASRSTGAAPFVGVGKKLSDSLIIHTRSTPGWKSTSAGIARGRQAS